MAAVNRPNADRGQLILVTGFTIAVVLVALVVLLNTVIYTENLATRGVDAGGADAIEYRATIVGSVGELIEVENERFDEGYPPTTAVATGTGTIADALAERHLVRGAVAESELKGGADGITTGPSIVWQAEVESEEADDRTFTSSDGDPDWTVVTGTNDLEGFVLTVTPTELADVDDDTDTKPFRIVIDDWSMGIEVVEVVEEVDGEDVVGERIEVTVGGDDGSSYEYDPADAPLEIDLVGGTIDAEGRETATFETPDAGGIQYENGDRATGTFELRSDGTPNEGDLTEYGETDASAPFYTYLVESVDLAIHYETAELRYTTEATVERGEST